MTGLDSSTLGVEQLNKTASESSLNVRAITRDIYSYSISDSIDIVILDSMLHFYKNDIVKESNLMLKILKEIKSGGVVCVCLQKGKVRENILMKLYIESGIQYEVLYNNYVDYPEANTEYLMYIVKKEI